MFSYVYRCRYCTLEFETSRPRAQGPRRQTCDECRAHQLTLSNRDRQLRHRRALAGLRPMSVPEIHEQWPSTTWGVAEWHAVLRADDALFIAILEGIAGASRRNTRAGRGELAGVVPGPRTPVLAPGGRALSA